MGGTLIFPPLCVSRKLRYNGTVKKCGRCGGKLRRTHRTFFERLTYMAKYRCRECQSIETAPRPFHYHFGNRCRCHKCGTYRITKLKVRDKIDPMEKGILNLVEKWLGGKLYHCKFCRIQFWDRRRYVAVPLGAPAPPPAKAPAEPKETGQASVPSNAP
jgi:hypothetical protein